MRHDDASIVPKRGPEHLFEEREHVKSRFLTWTGLAIDDDRKQTNVVRDFLDSLDEIYYFNQVRVFGKSRWVNHPDLAFWCNSFTANSYALRGWSFLFFTWADFKELLVGVGWDFFLVVIQS